MSRSRRGSRPGDPHGICIVDKPSGWTSHDVVARTRSLLNTPKVGHAGTLDPMATGVLVLGVGNATRLLRFITDGTKEYQAEITFGTETDSLDADGRVTATHDMGDVNIGAVTAAAEAFTGDILQVPPMVSALKVDGKRLHQLAREGIEVERKPRPVRVGRFELTATDSPLIWQAEVECSAGTYVRSLAADLGRALGGGAHLSALRRTAVGPYRIEEAAPIEAPKLLPVNDALRSLESCSISDELRQRVIQGAVLPQAEISSSGQGPWAIFDESGALLAVYEPFRDDQVKPSMVLAQPESGERS